MSHERLNSTKASRTSRESKDFNLRRGSGGFEVNLSKGRRSSKNHLPKLRIRRLLLLIIFLLLILLSAEVVYMLFTSDKFAIRDVRVEGANRVTLPLIYQKTPAVRGKNLFSLRTKKLSQGVNELSFLKAVKVHKRPPSSLVIQVKEREPMAYSQQPWGIAYLAKDGTVYSKPGAVPEELTELKGLAVPQRLTGKPLAGKKAAITQRALLIFSHHPEFRIQTLTIDANGWLRAKLHTGIELRLGAIDDLERKLSLAQTLISSIQSKESIDYIDATDPDAVVWKPVDAGKHKKTR